MVYLHLISMENFSLVCVCVCVRLYVFCELHMQFDLKKFQQRASKELNQDSSVGTCFILVKIKMHALKYARYISIRGQGQSYGGHTTEKV